jgi:hypothetical protein
MRSVETDSHIGQDPDEESRRRGPRLDDGLTHEGVEKMVGWTTALQRLIKGKTAMGKEVSKLGQVMRCGLTTCGAMQELRELAAVLDEIDALKFSLEMQDLVVSTRPRYQAC